MNNTILISLSQEELRSIAKSAVLEAFAEIGAPVVSQSNKIPEDALTTADAVVFLRTLGYDISINTLRNKIFLREIPSFKCGGRRMLSRAELTEWVESNRIPSPGVRAAQQMAEVASKQRS
ncbi:MAG: helix-turn-helix domain-containing protein [Alistipes sp.]|nr:helix-turn-helix domain-containing protein [Alistipes sp.]